MRQRHDQPLSLPKSIPAHAGMLVIPYKIVPLVSSLAYQSRRRTAMKKEKLATLKTVPSCLPTVELFVVVFTLIACVLPATAATGNIISHNTPSYVTSAKYLGATDPRQTIEVSIWLNPHNKSGLDQLAHDLYDKNSPVYRQWLKSTDIALHFAPTAAEAKTVQEFLESHNLKVVSVGPNNFYVRARGTVGDIQSAFQVQLNNYEVLGETLRANDRDPSVDAALAPLVQSVVGLDSGHFTHPLDYPTAKLPNGKTLPAPKATPGSSTFFSSNCFTGTTTESVTTDGSYPKATYSGNAYFTDIDSLGCGYTPAEIQTAYGLTDVYNSGYNGKGQTIVIVDWCGSLTITSDANVFNKRFGLPSLNKSNFSIINLGQSTCAGPDAEINLDVEWSHAIAPGANIDLIVPPTNSFQDTNEAVFYAINNSLGNVVSNSYGAPESLLTPATLDTQNLIAEIAAVNGISLNFATGDAGDYTAYGLTKTVSAPADSPYATGVGGVTLALTSANAISWQSAWGTNFTYLDYYGEIQNPPFVDGFDGGSGGGASGFYPAPSYQSSLKSSWRELPDVSWLADPFTGAVIAITDSGQSVSFSAIGGTSLATPMFSGLWAIANQAAGKALGQAAPYMYTLPSGAIYDILPIPNSNTNVTATIEESSSVTKSYTADEVMGLTGSYYSGLLNGSFTEGLIIAVSFGTDGSLQAAPGWDDATGVGTPNAPAFVAAFTPSAK
jgi:subtilase family serine protease